MPTVTSHNKDEFVRNEMEKRGQISKEKMQLKNKKGELIQAKIQLKDKELPVTMHPIEVKEGNKIANVNPEVFDKAFAKSEWQYVGEKGEGGIGNRYEKFAEWVKNADSMYASNVSVNEKGSVTFGDGRHRYAYLRDEGVKKIPMSMDDESIKYAKKHGYLTN